jgi:hypothetical protein
VLAGEHALRSVTADQRADRVVSIDIQFQDTRGPVRIQGPTRVSVQETNEGTARGLDIVDEKGRCTRLRFRAAPLPEMLDGVAPGELSP